MKKNIFKTLIALSVFSGGLSLSSCDSCNRRDADDRDSDTVTGTSGSYTDTIQVNGSSSDGTSGRVYSNPRTPGTSTPSSQGTASDNGMTREEKITNNIENSNSNDAYNSNGEPVDSGGSMGSGMGTGTGSTGNNSRVTNKEDQLKE